MSVGYYISPHFRIIKDLRNPEISILAILFSFNSKNIKNHQEPVKFIFMSNAGIAESIFCSVPTVTRAIMKLVARGYVEVTNPNNEYRKISLNLEHETVKELIRLLSKPKAKSQDVQSWTYGEDGFMPQFADDLIPN